MAILESAVVTSSSTLANKHVRDDDVTFEESTHTYFLHPGTPLCQRFPKSVSAVWGMFFEEFDPDKVLSLYYDSWCRNPQSKYFETITHMRSSGDSDVTIRSHIKDGWRSAGATASSQARVIYLNYVALCIRLGHKLCVIFFHTYAYLGHVHAPTDRTCP